MMRSVDGMRAKRELWVCALLVFAIFTVTLAIATPTPAWAESEDAEICGYAYLEDNDDEQVGRARTLVVSSSAREGESGFVRLGPVRSEYENYQDIPWQARGEQALITRVRFEGGVCPKNMAHWLEGCCFLTDVSFEGLDASRVVSMAYMFESCGMLAAIDLSALETSLLEDLNGMFRMCHNLTVVDARGFITSRTSIMSEMFIGCDSLDEVILSDCDSSNVHGFNGMFNGCTSLKGLDLSSLSFANAGDLRNMFAGCSSLSDLKLPSNRPISNQGVFAGELFRDCRALESVDLGFLGNAPFLIDTRDVFKNCLSLRVVRVEPGFGSQAIFQSMIELHGLWSVANDEEEQLSSIENMANYAVNSTSAVDFVPSFGGDDIVAIENEKDHQLLIRTGVRELTEDEILLGAVVGDGVPWESRRSTYEAVVFENTVAADSTARWFEGFSSLSSIEGLRNLDTSKVSDMSKMFERCVSLESLDLGGFNTSSARTLRDMFCGCESLIRLDLRAFDTTNVSDMSYMFEWCDGLEELDLSSFNTENVVNMRVMFGYCPKLRNLDLSSFDTVKVEDMAYLCSGCLGVETFKLSNLKTESVRNFEGMFNGCNMKRIDLSWLDTRSGTIFSYMFSQCDQLEEFSLDGFDFSNAIDATYMFSSCSALRLFDFASADFSSLGGPRNTMTLFEDNPCLATITRSPGAKVPVNLIPKGMWRMEESGITYRSDRVPEVNDTDGVQTLRKVSDNLSLYATLSLETGEFVVDSAVLDASAERTDFKVFEILDESYYDKVESLPWFDYRSAIKKVRMVDIAAAKNTRNWFNGCRCLSGVEWSVPIDAGNYDMANMFSDCASLKEVIIPSSNMVFQSDFSGLFSGCGSLQKMCFDYADYDEDPYWDMWANTAHMFDGCSSLKEVGFPGKLHVEDSAACMFRGCTSLAALDTSGFVVNYVTDFSEMFRSCSSLSELDLSSFDTTKGQDMKRMLHGCTSLGKVSLGSRFTFWGGAFSRLPGSELPSGAWQAVDSNGAPVAANRAYAADSLPNFTVATYVRVDEETPGLTIESVRGDTDDGSARYTVETQVVQLDDGTLEAQSDYVLGEEYDPEGGEFVIGDAAKASSTKMLTAKSITQQSVRSVSSNKNVHTVVIGSQVKSVKADAFANAPNVTALKVKSPKLTSKANMLNCLRGSKVSKVTISLSSANARVKVANAFAKWSGKKATRR